MRKVSGKSRDAKGAAKKRRLEPKPESGRGPGCVYVLVLALGLWLINGLWLLMDSRPPVWDMALHQTFALNYLSYLGSVGLDIPYWTLSGVYPPFVHVIIAAFYLLLGANPTSAALANLPATLILFWATYELASELAGPSSARWTCLITALSPLLIWMSRETILDYWLTSWVVLSLVALRRTHGFAGRNSSLVFGFVVAAGLLIKWFFVAFIAFPVVYLLARERIWHHPDRLTNFLSVVLLSAAVAGLWYIPNLSLLIAYFSENARIGALEGEPPIFSIQSLIYYLRLLEGYQLFGLLFALLVVSCIVALRQRLIHDAGFVGVTIAGAWLTLTLIRTKDPRFTMPLLPLLALFPGAYLQALGQSWLMKTLRALLVGTLCLQAYVINFGASWLPEKFVLLEGYQGTLRWDWNLYMQNYFGILGPPRAEDWRLHEILSRIDSDAKSNGLRPNLGLVPDLPRFNTLSFNLYARLLRIPVGVCRLVLTPEGIHPIYAIDYVVTVEGDQGISWTTRRNRELNQIVGGSNLFWFLERFPLPNGNYASLYRISREPNKHSR